MMRRECVACVRALIAPPTSSPLARPRSPSRVRRGSRMSVAAWSPDRRSSCRSFSMSVSTPRFLISSRPMPRSRDRGRKRRRSSGTTSRRTKPASAASANAISGQIADARRDRGQLVLGGHGGRQSGGQQGRIGLVEVGAQRPGLWRMFVPRSHDRAGHATARIDDRGPASSGIAGERPEPANQLPAFAAATDPFQFGFMVPGIRQRGRRHKLDRSLGPRRASDRSPQAPARAIDALVRRPSGRRSGSICQAEKLRTSKDSTSVATSVTAA